MTIPPNVVTRMINKSLEKYEITYEEMIKKYPSGFVDKKVYWYEHFHFESQEEYDQWKEFCLKELRKVFKHDTEENIQVCFNYFDMQWGLTQPYLFIHKEDVPEGTQLNLL